MFSWRRPQGLVVSFTSWTAICCDVLDETPQWAGDSILAAMTRLASTVQDAADSVPGGPIQTAQQSRLIWLGLEMQVKDLESRLDVISAASGKDY
jgi:hypothetical protein